MVTAVHCFAAASTSACVLCCLPLLPSPGRRTRTSRGMHLCAAAWRGPKRSGIARLTRLLRARSAPQPPWAAPAGILHTCFLVLAVAAPIPVTCATTCLIGRVGVSVDLAIVFMLTIDRAPASRAPVSIIERLDVGRRPRRTSRGHLSARTLRGKTLHTTSPYNREGAARRAPPARARAQHNGSGVVRVDAHARSFYLLVLLCLAARLSIHHPRRRRAGCNYSARRTATAAVLPAYLAVAGRNHPTRCLQRALPPGHQRPSTLLTDCHPRVRRHGAAAPTYRLPARIFSRCITPRTLLAIRAGSGGTVHAPARTNLHSWAAGSSSDAGNGVPAWRRKTWAAAAEQASRRRMVATRGTNVAWRAASSASKNTVVRAGKNRYGAALRIENVGKWARGAASKTRATRKTAKKHLRADNTFAGTWTRGASPGAARSQTTGGRA